MVSSWETERRTGGPQVRTGEERRIHSHGWFTLVCLLLVSSPAAAGFAELSGSPRGTALGGALAAAPRGSESVYWNPSGLLLLPERELAFTYADLFGLDLARHTVVHFGWPFAEKEYVWEGGDLYVNRKPPPANYAIGAYVSNLSADSGETGYRETQVGAAFAWRLPQGVHAGVTLRFLSAQSDAADVSGSGQALDFGAMRRVGPFNVGMTARNLYSSLDWESGEDDPLPERWHLGLSYDPERWPVLLTSEWSWRATSTDFSRVGGGLEWTIFDVLAIRGAVVRTKDPVGTETEISGGVGFRWKELRIEYGTVDNPRELGMTHRWGASLEI